MQATEGDNVYLEGLGTVRITKIYPSGSAIVEDVDGRRWLVPADAMANVETCLFSYL